MLPQRVAVAAVGIPVIIGLTFLGGPAFEQARANIRHLTSTEESVNGVLANHYQVGAPGQQFFNDLLADAQLLRNVNDLKWDLWLAQEGAWPVRLRASATITADLRVLNDLNLPAPSSWELSIDVSIGNRPLWSSCRVAAQG